MFVVVDYLPDYLSLTYEVVIYFRPLFCLGSSRLPRSEFGTLIKDKGVDSGVDVGDMPIMWRASITFHYGVN